MDYARFSGVKMERTSTGRRVWTYVDHRPPNYAPFVVHTDSPAQARRFAAEWAARNGYFDVAPSHIRAITD